MTKLNSNTAGLKIIHEENLALGDVFKAIICKR